MATAKLYNLARVSTATTGTGTITLGSAVSGFLTFAQAGIADGETVTYAIKDGANSEIGRGVYTSSGTTLTRSVLRSTNSNTAISLSGSAEVFITAAAEDFDINDWTEDTAPDFTADFLAAYDASAGLRKKVKPTNLVREKLTANRNYYVRTDGSDSNNGLANTSGGAFLTIQKAIDVASALDLSTYSVTINVADGTYAITTSSNLAKDYIGAGPISIIGNTTTPANCIISCTSGVCFDMTAVTHKYVLRGFTLTKSGSSARISLLTSAPLDFGNIVFAGTGTDDCILAQGAGCFAEMKQDCTISASAPYSMFRASFGATVTAGGRTITVSGTPAWGGGGLITDLAGIIVVSGVTWSGSATGKRYDSVRNGIIFTGGAGATAIPGNASGTTATQGQYL